MSDVYEAALAAYAALPEKVQQMLQQDHESLLREDFQQFYWELLEAFTESSNEIAAMWEGYQQHQWLEFMQGNNESWMEFLANTLKPVNTPKD